MSSALTGLAIGIAAGSIPFAWLLYRAATGRDLRNEGSGNPGATNLQRQEGVWWGAAALALDAGKGAAAVVLAAHVAGDVARVPAVWGAVVGHVFSPWLLLRGGKGVATAAGAFAVVAPAATAIAAVAFTVSLAATRFVSAGSVVGAASLPIAVWLLGPGASAAYAAAGIALLVAWRHRANFARMRAGTEPRVGRRL